MTRKEQTKNKICTIIANKKCDGEYSNIKTNNIDPKIKTLCNYPLFQTKLIS